MFDVGMTSFPWQLPWKQQLLDLKLEFWKKCIQGKVPACMAGSQMSTRSYGN